MGGMVEVVWVSFSSFLLSLPSFLSLLISLPPPSILLFLCLIFPLSNSLSLSLTLSQFLPLPLHLTHSLTYAYISPSLFLTHTYSFSCSISRATPRTMNQNHWIGLQSQLNSWKTNLDGILRVLSNAKLMAA